jgi:hypothetical protein
MNSLIMLFLIIFVMVDDYCQTQFQASSYPRSTGPTPKLADSEVITLSLVMELLDKPQEYLFLKDLKRSLPTLFPCLISQSRFNRRRRTLCPLINQVRHSIMGRLLPLCQEYGLLDTLPVKVVGYKRSKRRSDFTGSAAYGYCAAKDEKYFGFKLVLLVSPEGLPINFAIVPANTADADTPWEVLATMSNLLVLADKGMIGKKQQEELKQHRNITLVTPKRKNQPGFNSQANQLLSSVRQMVETIGNQLNAVVNLNRHYAKTVSGFLTRVTSKLAAVTVGFAINVQFGLKPLSLRNLAYELA